MNWGSDALSTWYCQRVLCRALWWRRILGAAVGLLSAATCLAVICKPIY